MNTGSAALWVMVAALAAGAIRPRLSILAVGASAALASLGVLVLDFATEDWGNAYVVGTTRAGLPLPVRLAGLWGGAEGSLLVWTVLLAWGTVIVRLLGGWARPGAALTAAYGLVILLTADPFERFDAPAVGGLGLQPVLEHPAMVWHPPILYAGLVGMIVATLVAFGRPDRSTLGRTIGGALALLTAGLATGAAWAHAELGWGGFWAWDPIESAGMVAWLAGAAALHVRSGPVDRSSALVWVLPGVAAIWATTLTRAGLVESVHAFADRPGLTTGLVVIAIGWTAVVGARSRQRLGSVPEGRRVAFAVASLAAAAGIVALGTYEPAVERLLGGDSVAIAGRFFSRALWPVAVAAGVGAVWLDRSRWSAGAGAAAGMAVVPWAAGPFGLAIAATGGAVAGSALAAAVGGRRGWLAHVGAGILLIGIAGTMAAELSSVSLRADQPVEVGDAVLVHRTLELRTEAAQERVVATIEVDRTVLQPELVVHRLRSVPTAEAATRRSWLSEIQVILVDGTAEQATYRINVVPRLVLLWVGAGLIALGVLGRFRLLEQGVDELVGVEVDEVVDRLAEADELDR